MIMGVRPGEEVTGSIQGQSFTFLSAHREDTDSPVAAVVSLSVPVSLDDLSAAVWISVNVGMTFDEIADDDYARSEIIGTVFNYGAMAIDDARREMDAVTPQSGSTFAVATAIRARVAELFGTPSVPSPRRPRSGATR